MGMFTDTPPRQASLLSEYLASDQRIDLGVPQDERFRTRARAIEAVMEAGKPAAVLYACREFLAVVSDFYKVRRPELRVLAARPLRVREGGWSTELFGDYNPSTTLIRIWMRTAVRKQITSFGTFFSTLCHEFCHHLDCWKFAYRGSPHTRGFYQRVGGALSSRARDCGQKAGVGQNAARPVADRLAADAARSGTQTSARAGSGRLFPAVAV